MSNQDTITATTKDGKTVTTHPLVERHTERSPYSYFVGGLTKLVQYVASQFEKWEPNQEYDETGKNVFTVEVPAEEVKSGKVQYIADEDPAMQSYLLFPVRSREGANETPRITGPYLLTDQPLIKPDSVQAKAIIWSKEMAQSNTPADNPTEFQVTSIQGSPIKNEAPELSTILNNAYHVEGDGKGGTNYVNLQLEQVTALTEQLRQIGNQIETLKRTIKSTGLDDGSKDALYTLINNYKQIVALGEFFTTLGMSWNQLHTHALLADSTDHERITDIIEVLSGDVLYNEDDVIDDNQDEDNADC